MISYHMKKVGQFASSKCKKSRELYFVCDNGHVTRREIRCNRRFVRECPYCAEKWRKETVERYKKIVSRMKSPKHVVLTLRKRGKHVLEDLSKLVQRCRFYLRRQGYKIRGFVFCIEPPNHVHCVWDCDYIPQNGLVNIWRSVPGDSFVVYIKRVDRQRWRGCVKYIAKYITKISECGSSISFQGVHVVNSWGDGGYYKKIRMACKLCGSYFEPLWYCGQVDDVDNDAVEFVEIDNDYG